MDRTCPNPVCKAALKDDSKPHCREQRSTPCGWIICGRCGAVSDRRGNYSTEIRA